MDRGRRLRLAAVIDTDGWGGAEIVLVNVLTHLVTTWDVVVLGTDRAVVERLSAEVPGTEAAVVPPHRGPADVVGAARHLRAVRRLGVDAALVNLNQAWAAPLLQAGALSVARVPTITVEHTATPAGGRLGPRLKPWNSRRLAAHLCVGESAARRLEQIAHLPAGSMGTVRNGVPWRSADPLELPEGLSRPCMTWVGRLVHQKGIDVLLRAVALVPDLSFWIDGEGPLREELEALSAELGITDRVRFTGWGPNPRGVLASADLVAFAGRHEAWGLAIVEAIQAGRPVLATDLAENHELLRDAAAFYPVDDHVALAALLRERVHDAAALAAMGERSLAVARSLPTVEEMARSYDILLREAVRLGPGRRLPDDVLASTPAAPPA